MDSIESKSDAQSTHNDGSILHYLANGKEKPRDPDWSHHGVCYRTLCTRAACQRECHIRCNETTNAVNENQPVAREDEAKEQKAEEEKAEDEKAVDIPPTEFLLCCTRMGNCLCDEADEFMAHNAEHGLADPRLDPFWLEHNRFQGGLYQPTVLPWQWMDLYLVVDCDNQNVT